MEHRPVDSERRKHLQGGKHDARQAIDPMEGVVPLPFGSDP